jgi:hypothetical protein
MENHRAFKREVKVMCKIRASCLCSFAFFAASVFAPALFAGVHLNVIHEVFVGPPAEEFMSLAPDVRSQYVMLRMTSDFEQGTNNTFVRVEDADGNLLGRFGTFTANQASGGPAGCAYPNCPAFIIGTLNADNLFTFSFDQVANGQSGRVALPASGGRICYVNSAGTSVYDCVAWGNFDCTRSGNCSLPNGLRAGNVSGNGCDTNFGTPAAAGTGLLYGYALRRTSFNCAASENSTQFTMSGPLGFPHPANNAGSNNNTDNDGDGLVSVLDCNDANSFFWWPALEVRNFGVGLGSGKSAQMAWTSQANTAGPGVTYDLVRGDLTNPAGTATCFSNDQNTTGGMDPTVAGGYQTFYYLVRAGSGLGCAGTYGAGRDAFAATACP